MPRYPKADTVNGRLAENARLAQHVRLAALESISRPPVALLLRLLRNPTTPARLIALAAKKYQTETVRRELRTRARQRQRAAAQTA